MTQYESLRPALRSFVADHPNGWDHQDWTGLIERLRSSGHSVEPEAVGRDLERERLLVELERRSISGLGPKRREALADRFETWYSLSHASPEEIARIPSIHRKLAREVAEKARA